MFVINIVPRLKNYLNPAENHLKALHMSFELLTYTNKVCQICLVKSLT